MPAREASIPTASQVVAVRVIRRIHVRLHDAEDAAVRVVEALWLDVANTIPMLVIHWLGLVVVVVRMVGAIPVVMRQLVVMIAFLGMVDAAVVPISYSRMLRRRVRGVATKDAVRADAIRRAERRSVAQLRLGEVGRGIEGRRVVEGRRGP